MSEVKELCNDVEKLCKELGVDYNHPVYGTPDKVELRDGVVYVDYFIKPKIAVNFIPITITVSEAEEEK